MNESVTNPLTTVDDLRKLLHTQRSDAIATSQDTVGQPASAPPNLSEIDSLDRDHRGLQNKSLDEEIKLRRRYGYGLLALLGLQLIVMNLVFVFAGLKRLEFSDYVIQLYMGGTLLEIFGLVFVVTRYLFKR